MIIINENEEQELLDKLYSYADSKGYSITDFGRNEKWEFDRQFFLRDIYLLLEHCVVVDFKKWRIFSIVDGFMRDRQKKNFKSYEDLPDFFFHSNNIKKIKDLAHKYFEPCYFDHLKQPNRSNKLFEIQLYIDVGLSSYITKGNVPYMKKSIKNFPMFAKVMNSYIKPKRRGRI